MLALFVIVLVSTVLPASASQIVEVCPNPYGSDNAEYVIVNATSACVLDDGEGKIPINLKGLVIITKNKTAYRLSFSRSADIEFSKSFALSNNGETLQLIENGEVVDEFTYKRAEEGIVYFRTSEGWNFRYQDWTSFPPVEDHVVCRVIVCPASFCFEGEEVLLASYTFTDPRVVRGNVTLFLDASPAGGIPVEELEIAKKCRTYFLSSPSYKNFHYKFAVSGSNVVITTENWKWDKRGFIVEFSSKKAANLLKAVLEHDKMYASKPSKAGGLKGKYVMKAGISKEFSCDAEVFVLPDCNPIFDFISKARQRLYIEVPYMDFRWFDDSTPLLDAILKAARNGAEVKIILDSEYNGEKNEKTMEFLKNIAEVENLNMDAKLSRIPLHGKLVISDGDVLITSANFNRYGLKLNREVGVILHGEDVSDWLALQFMKDWKGEDSSYLLPAAIILALAIVIAYRAMAKR